MPNNKSKQIVSAGNDQLDSQLVNERLTPNPLSEFSLDKDQL